MADLLVDCVVMSCIGIAYMFCLQVHDYNHCMHTCTHAPVWLGINVVLT